MGVRVSVPDEVASTPRLAMTGGLALGTPLAVNLTLKLLNHPRLDHDKAKRELKESFCRMRLRDDLNIDARG